MKTTVVIPNYNGIKYLENCIETLKEAKKQSDFEILIVDNGSKDGSELLCKKYEEEAVARCIFFEENTGFCGAVNAGITSADTEYILLLNNDTEVEADFVKSLEEFMESHPKAFSASAKMIALQDKNIIDDCGDLYCALGWAFGLGKGKNRKKYNRNAKVFAACGGAAIYRKSVLDQIGAFDENHFAYLEDIDLGYRALIHGYQNYFCKDAVVYHAGSAVSGSRYNAFKIDLSAKNSIYLVYKNMPFLQMVLNLPFLLAGFFVKTLFFVRKKQGKTYVKGLAKGFKLCASKNGKKHKVKFKISHLPNYCKIQGLLWINTIRRFVG